MIIPLYCVGNGAKTKHNFNCIYLLRLIEFQIRMMYRNDLLTIDIIGSEYEGYNSSEEH